MIFRADDLSKAERTILTSYFRTTRSIAGCQANRRRIGHCLFGMRAVYGECVFVTLSPNRRHSALILRLSRARANDAILMGSGTDTEARRRLAGSTQPDLFIHGAPEDAESVEYAEATLKFPKLRDRQALNAQDPLSSVHHWLFGVRVLLPAAFGIRMCFNCPHCDSDDLDE